MKFDVEAPFSISCKRRVVSRESSISCHPSELEGRTGVVESSAFSGYRRHDQYKSVKYGALARYR